MVKIEQDLKLNFLESDANTFPPKYFAEAYRIRSEKFSFLVIYILFRLDRKKESQLYTFLAVANLIENVGLIRADGKDRARFNTSADVVTSGRVSEIGRRSRVHR